MDVVHLIRIQKLRDIAILALTKRFPISESFDRRVMVKDHSTRLAVLRDMLLQSDDVMRFSCTQLDVMPEAIYGKAFMTCIECCTPPYTKIEPLWLSRVFGQINKFTDSNADERISYLAGYIASNMAKFSSSLDMLLQAADSGGCGEALDEVIRQNLSLKPKFLVALHSLIPDPNLLRLADLSAEFPTGEQPYAYLEMLGVKKSTEWHLKEQQGSSGKKRLHLLEFALKTAGYEIGDTLNDQLQPFEMRYLIELIKSSLGGGNDNKCQELFNLCASSCDDSVIGKGNKTIIIQSGIPKQLLKNHPNLLGDSFANDLGV